jgi:hypothetical protein
MPAPAAAPGVGATAAAPTMCSSSRSQIISGWYNHKPAYCQSVRTARLCAIVVGEQLQLLEKVCARPFTLAIGSSMRILALVNNSLHIRVTEDIMHAMCHALSVLRVARDACVRCLHQTA